MTSAAHAGGGRFALGTVLRFAAGLAVGVAGLHLLPFEPTEELPAVSVPIEPAGPILALHGARVGDEVRVFVVGASLTSGFPYPARAGYARQMQAGLRSVLGRTDVHVMEYAKPALDSPKLVEMVERLLRDYDPTLICVTLGSNEFANRIFGGRRLVPENLAELVREHASRARVALRRLLPVSDPEGEEASLQKRLLALVWTAKRGEPSFSSLPVSDADQAMLIARMRRAMRRMSAACAARHVPLVFNVAVYGLGAYPPWGLSGSTCARVDRLVERSWRGLERGMLEQVEGLLASQADRADLQFLHGRLLRKFGRPTEARAAFERARDLDTVPMHQTGTIVAAIESEAKALGRACLRLDAPLQARAVDGIQGSEFFLDYGHLDVDGHRILAEFLTRQLAGLGLIPALPADWDGHFPGRVAMPPIVAQQASANMAGMDGVFAMVFGNLRDAIPYLERAFLQTPDANDRARQLHAINLVLSAYGFAGRRDEIITRDQAATLQRAARLYAEMLVAKQNGTLDDWIAAVLSPR